MDNFTFGQLINYIYEYERNAARARGEDVPDLEARYRQLKNVQPLVEQRHARGEISDEEYRSFTAALKEWEE